MLKTNHDPPVSSTRLKYSSGTLSFSGRPSGRYRYTKYRHGDPIRNKRSGFSRADILSVTDGATALSSQSEQKLQFTNLNGRLASYIDTVKRLEAKNKVLETRVTKFLSSKGSSHYSGNIYELELEKLRSEIGALAHENASLKIQLENCEQNLDEANGRLHEEVEVRKDAEKELDAGRASIDQHTLTLFDKDRALETLQQKCDLLKAALEEAQHLANATSESFVAEHAETQEGAAGGSTEVSDALKEIREAYEHLTLYTDSQVVTMYKNIIADLQDQLKAARNATASARADAAGCDKTLQTYMSDMEKLRSENETLVFQNEKLQETIEQERDEANRKIQELEDRMQAMNEEMAECIAQYSKSMNMKKAFELELATYQKILEGEEQRIDQRAGNVHSGSETVTETYTAVTTETTSRTYYEETTEEHPVPQTVSVDVPSTVEELLECKTDDKEIVQSSSSSSASDSGDNE